MNQTSIATYVIPLKVPFRPAQMRKAKNDSKSQEEINQWDLVMRSDLVTRFVHPLGKFCSFFHLVGWYIKDNITSDLVALLVDVFVIGSSKFIQKESRTWNLILKLVEDPMIITCYIVSLVSLIGTIFPNGLPRHNQVFRLIHEWVMCRYSSKVGHHHVQEHPL